MALYMDRRKPKTMKVIALTALHGFTIVLGSFMTVAGTYTTIQSIVNAYKTGTVGSGAFTCQ